MSEKLRHPLITPERLQLRAVVYVRQSSAPQIRDNWGSTRIQEEQAQLARAYGWPEWLIHTILGDLGRSGTGTAHRPGWQEMLDMIAKRLVGAVFVWNVSRLSRALADFEGLRLLCKIYGVILVIDGRPADPGDPNDTVLLQLQTAIAQHDNHTRAQTMLAARRRKASEGALVSRLSVGWVEKPDGTFDFDPEVKPAIDDIIQTFWKVQSVLATVRALSQAGKKVPVRRGRRIVWKEPTAQVVRKFLLHPSYAGDYCFGMSENRPEFGNKPDGYPRRRPAPREKWIVYPNHHPAYLPAADQDRIRAILNRNRFENRNRPGSGPALCQGLLRCARCGRTLAVNYPPNAAHRYMCQKNQTEYARQRCFDFKGDELDAAIEAIFLETVKRPPIESLERAMEESKAAFHARENRQKADKKRLDFEVRIARDRYQECDPRNRLVAAEAEKDLEKALHAQLAFEERVKIEASSPAEERGVDLEQLCALAEDIPRIWRHPEVTMEERKKLLATVIDHVVVDITETSIEYVIHWHSGVVTPLRLWRLAGRDQLILGWQNEGLWVREIHARLKDGDPETGQRWLIGKEHIYSILKKLGVRPNPVPKKGSRRG